MPASTSLVTWNLPEGDSNIESTYWGSIIHADPTATEFAVTCAPSCHATVTYTVGPWAQVTPPPDASTGTYDIFYSVPYITGDGPDHLGDYTSSWTLTDSRGQPVFQTCTGHCDIISTTVVADCTESWWGPEGVFNFTHTQTNPPSSYYAIKPMPITITAGLEKLASQASSSSSPASASTKHTTAPILSTRPGITSTSSPTTSLVATGSASFSVYQVDIGMLGVAGLLASLWVR